MFFFFTNIYNGIILFLKVPLLEILKNMKFASFQGNVSMSAAPHWVFYLLFLSVSLLTLMITKIKFVGRAQGITG